ncbi:MAG: tRNA glutamyl-Q(34) synthetase GluQRS [Bacteroidota bacterium]
MDDPSSRRADGPVRGRYAPSPTGPIHLGNARTALAAWLSCRAQGGTFVYRLEDLDAPRVVAGMATAQMDDLRWLGLDWEEGPDLAGPHAPYVQSARHKLYEAALDRLHRAERLFPCRVSRRELRELASAPHGPSGLVPYPASLRPTRLATDWYAQFHDDPDAALRFRVREGDVPFTDHVLGPQHQQVQAAVGDFVLKRRDGVYAYQLAVVVDDLAMGVTEVVRGQDLLSSTARQIQLIEALGGEPPRYAHLPLVLDAEGRKVSKREAEAGLALTHLREAGVQPEQVVGYLAYTLGLLERPAATPPQALIEGFDLGNLPATPWRLPALPLAALQAVPPLR